MGLWKTTGLEAMTPQLDSLSMLAEANCKPAGILSFIIKKKKSSPTSTAQWWSDADP